MHYYMIDLIKFSSPHVPTEDYSHIMVGDKVMMVVIIVESMVMMKAKKSPSRSEEGEQTSPKTLVFHGDYARVREKNCAPGVRVLSHI
jgi:hypothetical protein